MVKMIPITLIWIWIMMAFKFKKIKNKLEFLSLYYRQEIIWFIVGLVIGVILL